MKTRVVPHRRRRQGRTDYRKRLRLLKSGKPRLVVRRFLNSVQCQVISYEKTGDKTIASASSLDLKKAGWKAHAGNIPAAYLVGFLCGLRAKKSKIMTVEPNSKNLKTIKIMFEVEKITGQIHKTFDLEQKKQAHELSQNGGFCGKLVIKNTSA